MHTIIELFQQYMGTGLIMILYLAALVYGLLREKDPVKRCLFVYMPALLLVLYFQPWLSALFLRFAGDEIYYRILWLLPVTVTIAATCADLVRQAVGCRKVLTGVALALLLCISGNLVYRSPYFHPAENPMHMPSYVVDVCDAIVLPGREVMAVFPEEFLQFVRQYTPYVCMPYGRDTLLEDFNSFHELARLMQANVVDAERLAECAASWGCHYIVLSEDREIDGDLGAYGFPADMKIDGYVIYRNENGNFDLTFDG